MGVQVSLSIVCWRAMFNDPNRWRNVMKMQLLLLLLMPASLISVGVFSFVQKNAVKPVMTCNCYLQWLFKGAEKGTGRCSLGMTRISCL